MIKYFLYATLFFSLLLNASNQREIVPYDQLEFSAVRMGVKEDNTLLVIAGIQGDESGGFLSASILLEHYKITKGSLLVIPNLNFPSIVKNSRGPWGDMNRKFHKLSKFDKDYKSVQRVKKIILQDNIEKNLDLFFSKKPSISLKYSVLIKSSGSINVTHSVFT